MSAANISKVIQILEALSSNDKVAALAADAIIAKHPELAPFKLLIVTKLTALLNKAEGAAEAAKPGFLNKILSFFR